MTIFKTKLTLNTLLTLFYFLINTLAYSQTETISICEGQSITLNSNLSDFDDYSDCALCTAISFENIKWLNNDVVISNDSSVTLTLRQSSFITLETIVRLNCAPTPTCESAVVPPSPIRSIKKTYEVIVEACNSGTTLCDLPADSGPCDDNVNRYYYDKMEGNCKIFSYGGCEGNANNFESYIACIETACAGEVACPQGNPSEWDWIQRRIEALNQSNGCSASSMYTFEANGTTFIALSPGGEKICPTDLPVSYYTCLGDRVCSQGGLTPPWLDPCGFGEKSNFQTLWGYTGYYGCTHPAASNYNPEANTEDGSCDLKSEMTICTGDTVNLANIYDTGKLPETPEDINCLKLVTTVEGSDGTSSEDFMVSPWFTTTYTITKYYTSSDPSVNCPPGVPLVQTVKVIVEDCNLLTCANEAISLPNLAMPIPPPIDRAATLGCPQYLIRNIEPNDGSVTQEEDTYIVSPEVTTTYTVTSYYSPANPGGFCVVGQPTVQTFEVVVQNCVTVDDEVINICAGETARVYVGSNIPPSAPKGHCDHLTLSIEPDDGTVTSYSSGFELKPGISSSYTVTSFDGPSNAFDDCIPGTKTTKTYRVQVEDCEPVTNYAPGEYTIEGCPGDIFEFGASYSPAALCSSVGTIVNIDLVRNVPVISNYTELNNCKRRFTITGEGQFVYQGAADPHTPAIAEWKFNIVFNDNCSEVYDEVATICNGEEVTVNLAPEELYAGCWLCFVSELEDQSWSANGIEISNQATLNVSPTETTVYTFKALANSNCVPTNTCTPPIGIMPPPYRNIERTFKVNVEDCTEPDLTNKYPWLASLVNFDSCNGETITEYDVGSYSFIHIDSPSGGSLYYQDGTFYCNDALNYSCVAIYNLSNVETSWSCGNTSVPGCTDASAINYNILATVDDGSCEYIQNPNTVFNDYPWLNTLVNPNNCNNETITVYDAGGYNFIHIQNGSKSDLYYQNGTFYCSDAPGYSCVNVYNLSKVAASWACTPQTGCPESDPLQWDWIQNAIANTDGCSPSIIEMFDADGTTYVVFSSLGDGFICPTDPPTNYYTCNGDYVCFYSGLTPPGVEPSCNFGPTTNYRIIWRYDHTAAGCTDSNAHNYDPSATTDDGSCEYPPAADCSNYTGTFFFENCGGINYYFIELADGRVFDPYFAEGINFTPYEGQQVNFDFIINTDVNTPCSISESPITITCIDASNPAPVFEQYPWLSTIVNPGNCTTETITVYDSGYYNFINIKSPSGSFLYFQDGTYYCTDAPGYSCVSAYSLNNAIASWACGDGQNGVTGCTDSAANNYNPSATIDDGSCTYTSTTNYTFETYPWLNAIVNPINCNLQPQVIEYDFGHYAFIYVKTINGGSLYLNDGTFYCSDTDGQTCISNYSLTASTNTWVCNNGRFQKFDFVFTICEGESINLVPNYQRISIPCTCPPCGIAEPPGFPPQSVWSNPVGICSSTCFPLTVNPVSTTIYTATTEPEYWGDSGCYNPGAPGWGPGGGGVPPGQAGEQVTTNFLVIVESCPPAKTALVGQINEKATVPIFKLYPNPTKDKVFIELENIKDELTQITLIDMQGKVLQTQDVGSLESKAEMDVSNYPKGIYLIQLKNNTNTTIEKLIIE